jgi:hypothetical protein
MLLLNRGVSVQDMLSYFGVKVNALNLYMCANGSVSNLVVI